MSTKLTCGGSTSAPKENTAASNRDRLPKPANNPAESSNEPQQNPTQSLFMDKWWRDDPKQ